LITGHLGKASSGILILQEKCNAQGAIDQGILSNGGVKNLLNKAWEGKVTALYIAGEDPIVKSSHPDRLKEAFERLQLLVVQDLFMTETAKMAHVVLPAASFVEKGGTYTSLERRVQKLNPLRTPAHGSKSDFDIFLGLLRRLEVPISGETPEAVFSEISRQNLSYQGVQPGEQWPKGSPYLYSNGFPDGKAKLIHVEDQKPSFVSKGVETHPLLLIQRPSLFQSGLLSLRSENLEMVQRDPFLEISPDDAGNLGIEDGEMVKVSNASDRSIKIKVKVKVSKRPAQGVVTAPWPCRWLRKVRCLSKGEKNSLEKCHAEGVQHCFISLKGSQDPETIQGDNSKEYF
jgi:predicted molibdopterin-dependent oxidoreductase YjgC